MDNQAASTSHKGSKQHISSDPNGKEEGVGTDSKALTLSSESTATDVLSPDGDNTILPLAQEEPLPLDDTIAQWRQRARSGGGSPNDECDDNIIVIEDLETNAGSIYPRNNTENGNNTSQSQLLPNQTTDGYNVGHNEHENGLQEIPLTSPILLDKHCPPMNPEDDVPYPLPTSGFLPDITINGAKNTTDLSDIDPNSFGELCDDNDDTQSIHSYDDDHIEAYDRRKEANKPQNISEDLEERQRTVNKESNLPKTSKTNLLSTTSRMLKIPSISALVSSKKKKNVEALEEPVSFENVDEKRVFPSLLSSTPTNETRDIFEVDIHHPFMSPSGLDIGDNYYPEDDTKNLPYTQIEMIRWDTYI